jgi:hypothetical protein
LRVFSLRHQKSIASGDIEVIMPERLRSRLWQTMEKHTRFSTYCPIPGDNWTEQISTLEEAEAALRRVLGVEALTLAVTAEGERPDGQLKRYFKSETSVQALDVIEVFYSELHEPKPQAEFQTEINEAMLAFSCPWRLADGCFFLVASEFIEREIIERAADLMATAGFEGATDEFRAARDDLTGGDTKDAIHKANNSFESTLKAILGVSSGTADHLCKQFVRAGYLDDVPDDARAPLMKILLGPSTLRHKLGGHGQGRDVVSVPRPYAELALSLAGTLNLFAVQQYLAKRPSDDPEPATWSDLQDDIPF